MWGVKQQLFMQTYFMRSLMQLSCCIHRPVWATGGTLETEYFIDGNVNVLELSLKNERAASQAALNAFNE